METNGNSGSNFARGRKLFLGGFVSVLAIIACTLVLSATAFAGTAGESAFDVLLNSFTGGALKAPANSAPAEYKYDSVVYQDVQFNEANGEEGQSNASHSIVVSFTNNYDCEAARDDSLAAPQTFTYDEGEGFSFTVGIDAAAGAPAGVVQSDGLDLQYTIGADNKVTFTSVAGIFTDGTIDIKYGELQTAYTLIYFYQGSDGGWRDDHTEEVKIGSVYQNIPTQDEVNSGLSTGFVVDTYDTGVALPGGIGSVSLYYARTVNSVVFDNNGGVNGPGAFFERSEVEINKEDAIPTRAGYSFDGWFTAPEGGDEVGYDTYTVVPFEKETVYYAHWTMERPNNKYVTVVYWGQKAEVSSSFDTNDYEYISEAYFERPYNSDFVFTTDAEVRPKTGGIITEQKEVQYFDADYNGEAERPIADCFTMTIASAKVDASKKVQDDDYTLYNVYLPRVTYTWEFVNSTSSSATTVADTITARWGQNISDKYKTISQSCFSRDIGAWNSSITPGTTNILTHMNFTNHLVSEGTQWYKESSLGDIESTYYIQKIGAPDSHRTAQEIENNYKVYAVNLVQSGWSINEDEFIKIEGFITPNSEDDADAPHSGTYIWERANLDFFYKRSESSMSLYMIDTGAATPSPNNVVNITGIDYETTYGDIPVPEGTPGTFVEGMPHTLRYFTPLNPNIDNVDKNYVFGGWALNNNPGSQAIDLDSYVMPQKAAWLYAKWVAPSDIKISFQQVDVPKTEGLDTRIDPNPIVFANQTYQKKIDTTSQPIPTPTEFENFYFLYWYYYNEGETHEEANRHYFDPVTMTVPAHDLYLYPEYSSTEPNTEFLVSPVKKPGGTITQTEDGVATDVHFFYVKSGNTFTVSGENNNTITINAMDDDLSDEIVETLTATPNTGYRFEGWQITFQDETTYAEINTGDAVTGPCGVKPVFVPDVDLIDIYIQPKLIVKQAPAGGGKSEDVVGNDVFDAYCAYPEFFNKDKIYTLGKGTQTDPIRIDGCHAGNYSYSDWFTNYDWHYTGADDKVNFVIPDAYSTLYVGDLGITKPTKVDDFTYDAAEHNAFATEGHVDPEIQSADSFRLQYFATTATSTPDESTEWEDSINDVKIKDVGIYYLWYRVVYHINTGQHEFDNPLEPATIGAVRIFEDEPIVPPTKADDFYYDQNQHPLFATAGSAPMGGVMQYGYSSNETTEPTTWYDSIDDIKVNTYGAFYLWYRIDEGEAVLLKVGDETQVVLGYAAYAAYFEEATAKYAAKSIVIDFYDPLQGNEDEDNVIAYLPKGVIYAHDEVPWRAYFLSPNSAEYFYITNSQLENWLNGEDISYWWSDGYYIKTIYSYEEMFYTSNGQCRVTAASDDVFGDSNELKGGNGTEHTWYQPKDLTYLHEDYANEDGSLHQGYISNALNSLNVLYDYNGGSGVPAVPETRQIVDVNKYYTVTGVNKSFAGVPKWPGHKFLGWKYDDDNIYATGDTVSAFYPSGTTHFSQITLVALWEDVIDPVHTPPVAADDFWFDNVRHHLFSQAGSAEGEGNVFYYTYTTVQNPENDPVPGIYETWESNINSLQSWPSASPQVYYLWYKINEDGAYHKVLDGEGNHAYVASNTLNFFQNFDDQGEFFVHFSLYMPREGYIPKDIGGDTIKIDMEYTERYNIPWSINSELVNYMIVDDDVRVWFQHNTNKAYLTNWFSGFPNLKHIYASESTFYNTETSESYVQGQNVFTNSNSLFGGNGTAYATRTADDLTYLHVDKASVFGYLTDPKVNITYDLNGGTVEEEKEPYLSDQYVPADASFTVGGVDNFFVAPEDITPPSEDKELLGWKLADSETVYENGVTVSAASGASTGALTLTAVWSGDPEPEAVPVPTWKKDILYDAAEHDVSAVEFWNNYATEAMGISGVVKGTDPDTYTATFTLNPGYVWDTDPASTDPANVNWSIVATEVDVPTWIGDITYDGTEHNADNEEFWSGYNKVAMTISGETTGTEAGDYTATFTLNNGYVWTGQQASVRSADCTWTIKPVQVKPEQEVTVDVHPSEGFYVNQFGKMEVLGIQENPTMSWELITTDTNFPGRFDFASDDKTFIAYIQATTAGQTKAVLHINETVNFAATDVPVAFEILGQTSEAIQLEESYDVNVADSIDVEAAGISAGRMVQWEVVSGGDKAQIKYVNNNPVAVVGVAEGTATIKITAKESVTFTETSATTTINVENVAPKPEQELVLSKENIHLDINYTDNVNVSGEKENPSILWTIADTSIAQITTDPVDHTITVKGLKYGTTSLTVTTSETTNYAETSKAIDVIVEKTDNVYLKNRSGIESTIKAFSGAKSAEFSRVIPDEYLDSLVIDDRDAGTIKAYKVGTQDDYKVVIASTQNICSNETSMASFFKSFTNLESVEFNNLDTSKSTSFIGTFSGCRKLESVYLPFDTSNVDDFGWMFDNGCENLVKVEIGPNFVVRDNAKLRFMFDHCTALTSIIVPEGTDWSNVTGDCSGMFTSCINLPHFNPKEIGKTRAFEGQKSGVYGYFTAGKADKAYLANRGSDKDSIIKKYREAKSVEFSHVEPQSYEEYIVIDRDNEDKIRAYKVADGDGYKVVIYSSFQIYASNTSFTTFLKKFTNLESVDFGDVNTSEATSLCGMFSSCKNLTSVTLNFDTSYVTDFSYMFDNGCEKLTEINLGNDFVVLDGANVSQMFIDCKSLTTIRVKHGTDWSQTAGSASGMFTNCTKLPHFTSQFVGKERAYCGTKGGAEGYFTDADANYVYMKNRGNDKDSIIKGFRGAENVSFSNQIPASYSEAINVDDGNIGEIKAYKIDKTDGAYDVVIASEKPIAANETTFATFFKGFTNLLTVDFGNINTDSITSLVGTFSGCKNLKKINMETFNTENVASFAWMCDAGCTALVEVKFGDNFIVQENAVLTSMFDGCSALASIIVPKGTDLTYVMGDSTSMFKGCINLPYFSADQDDYRRAYEGVKDGVTGYFVDGSSQVVYLANRGEDKDSIIKNYRDAKSVVFTHTEPISFDEYIAIDTERDGWIKAYKVADGDGYKVEIYSAYTMVSRSTSLTTMFKNFNKLTSVDFGDLDTSNATSLVGLFSGCKNLAEVTLNFDTRNVTDFGWMFDNGCTSLVTVNLGDDFVVGENSNLVSMFDGCSKLENIMVKDGTDWSTTKGNSSNMFANCVLLPEFSSSATNNVRAYTGEKSSVKGYFKARGASRLFNLFNWFNNKENGEQANATYSLNVSATNNYDCEDARQVKEVVDPVPKYEENTPFTLEVSFDPTYGTPTNFILSEDLNATCTVGVNNTITIHSDNGLTKDSSIDICYGSLQTAYKVLYFHQLPDGGWRDYDEADTVTYIGDVYAAIPTTEQVEDPDQLYEGFAVDTYDIGTALPGGIGAVSVYYARKVNTVVFDDNGGVNGPGTFYERSDRDINKDDVQPTRAGYTFEGWYTDPVEGEEVDYDTYTVVPRASETKYYAHWTMDNVDSKVITVIYWGENADLATEGQFSTGDYSYITEATYTAAYNSMFSISADADLRPDNDKCTPKVSQIDTDGDGTLDHDVDDCYSLTFNPSDTSLAPKVDDPISVKDDDTTVYNVYLKRTKFTWEFRTFAKLEVKSTGRRGFTETWSFGELYDNGTIKARWGQNITDKYSIVENEAFGADDKVRNWVVDGEGVQRGDWDVSSNITYMGYFTNMDLNNRVQSSDNSTKPFGKNDLEYDDVDGIKYYLQKVNAGSEHSTPQEIAQNYNLAYTQYLPADTEFTYSEEDWINIDGFDAPDKNSGVDSPVLGTTVEDGDEFFYKRSERDLYLYVVQPRAGEATGYYTKANTVDYQAPIADVDVSDLPGTWKDASAPHTLANFIPNKPSLSALDTNFVFRGWSLSPDSELIKLEDLTMPLGTFSLYARWGAPQSTVTFYQVSAAKTEDIITPTVFENQTYKQKIDTSTQAIPTPNEFEMFYFLYWYYYDEGAQHTEANRHYFDPYNMTVPAHDLVLYPEYSSLEPGTEFLVSPVHKAHGTLSQTTGGQSVDVHYFYVKANEQFTVDAENRTLTITDMDGKVQQLTATPDSDYKFSGWQYTYGTAEEYLPISTGSKVEHACGVKAVFEPINPIVDVPTWKEDITYNGEEHVVTSVGYWNNFNTNAMTIGGAVRATEVGTYTATFTLKEGYVWRNGSTDPANVAWHIINGAKEDQDVTIEVMPEDGFYVNQYGKLEVKGIQDNPTMQWEMVTDAEFPGTFEFNIQDTTYVAYIHALTAGNAKATLHVNATEHFNAIDVPVEFEILGQATEQIQLDDSYDVVVGEKVDVTAEGLTASRMVEWEVVDGADKVQLKYVNNNPVAVVGLAEGSAIIKITAKSSIPFAESSATTTINVAGSGPKPQQDLVLSRDKVQLDLTLTDHVNVSGDKENPSILWTIEDTSIAQITTDPINHTITVKGLKYGTTTLTVTSSETENYAETSKSIEVVVAQAENVYLKNRLGYESIIGVYRGAKSAEFTHVIPDQYLESIVIDDQNAGTIKAYKVGTHDNYKVIIASTQNICTNETSFASFFKGFADLESVEFNNINTSKATSLIAMFSGCHNLKSVNLPFNTSNVVDYGWMFDANCEKLVSVEIGPDFVVRENATLHYMFENCTSLTSIVVPAGTDWSNATGESTGMFTNCVNLPYFVPQHTDKTRAYAGQKGGVNGYFVTQITDKTYLKNRGTDKDSIIKQYREAKSVEFSHTQPQAYEDYIVIDRDNEDKIRAYKVADGLGYKVVIYCSNQIYCYETSFVTFFKNFVNLESVDFGDINTSEAKSLCGMFSGCRKLPSVTLNFDTSAVTDFTYMFDNWCEKLVEIDLGNDFVVGNGANVSLMFVDCTSLTTIKVKHGTDWSQTAGSSTDMFSNCTNLPHFDPQFVGKDRAYCGSKDGVEGYFTDADADYVYMKNRGDDKDSIIKRYRGADNVSFSNQIPAAYSEAINIDEGDLGVIKAYKIDKGSGTYDVIIASNRPIAAGETSLASLFKGFNNLVSVDFGELNTDSITSLVGTFSGCKKLTKINMETFNTEHVTSFGWMCDAGCSALVEVKLGNKFVVQENAVLTCMFDSCSSLASIIVPKGTDWSNVKGDSTGMFNGCLNLPYHVDGQDNCQRAYEGTKDGVYGYFVDGTSQVVYLTNRGADKDSIIKNYRDAKSVVFTHTEPTSYEEFTAIDTEREGWVKAYKVADGDGYKVEIYSAYTMVSRATSLTTMFKNFVNLTSVDFGDLDTSNATSLVGMFSGCKSLSELTLNFDTRNVTDFGWMCDAGCTSLVTVNLGDNFVVGENSSLVSMFDGCSKLQNIMVKDGTDWSTTKGDSSNMFANCVLLPGFSSSAVNISRAYTGEKSGVKGYLTARNANKLCPESNNNIKQDNGPSLTNDPVLDNNSNGEITIEGQNPEEANLPSKEENI